MAATGYLFYQQHRTQSLLDTRLYRSYHLPQALRMRCNGRPVPVDENGLGQVRFQAPWKPGPATWTGSITFVQNGRDTTFKVLVPYRVALP